MVTSPDFRESVLQRDQQRYDAMARKDVETLTRLLDDELIYTHSSGHRDTKQSYLEAVAADAFRYGPVTHSELETHVVGECVLVIGEMHTSAVIHGVAKELHNASIAVWRDGRNGPQLLALQTTPLPAH